MCDKRFLCMCVYVCAPATVEIPIITFVWSCLCPRAGPAGSANRGAGGGADVLLAWRWQCGWQSRHVEVFVYLARSPDCFLLLFPLPLPPALSPALPPAVLFPLVYLLVLTRFGLSRQAAFAFCLLLYFYYFRQPRFAHPLSALTHTRTHTPIHTHTHVLTHMSAKIVYASLFYSIWLIFAGGLFFAGFYSHSQFRFPFQQRLLNLLRIYCKSYAKFARHLRHVATANWKVAQRKYEIASLWVLNMSSSGIGRND